jgi:hypothetical protein
LFHEFYSSLLETDIKVFTDGSKLVNRMAGAGFAIYQSRRQFLDWLQNQIKSIGKTINDMKTMISD